MVSPVPKWLRTDAEIAAIPEALRGHVNDLSVDPTNGVKVPGAGRHRAKFAPGLSTALYALAGTGSIGDPMCGTGTLAYELRRKFDVDVHLNDLDEAGMRPILQPLMDDAHVVTFGPADAITWSVEACIFSPPYYPRTDRRRPNAHDDAKRGPVVGFRDKYDCDHPALVGNPGGVDALLKYREQMTAIYSHMRNVCGTMIVVTKNWMRLGVELRLDLDTIIMCSDAGWNCVERHGFVPQQSLWSRFNSERGLAQGVQGMVTVEDVMVFKRRAVSSIAIAAE